MKLYHSSDNSNVLISPFSFELPDFGSEVFEYEDDSDEEDFRAQVFVSATWWNTYLIQRMSKGPSVIMSFLSGRTKCEGYSLGTDHRKERTKMVCSSSIH